MNKGQNRSSSRSTAASGLSTIAVSGIALIVLQLSLTERIAQLLVPLVATIAVFFAFSSSLRKRVGPNLFSEIGFIYLGWAVIYTLVPGLGFVLTDIDAAGPLATLLPSNDQLGMHLWRHVLFILSVAIGYLVCRGRIPIPDRVVIQDARHSSDRMVIFLIGLIGLCILSMLLLSAPVSNYYEHYVRYEHLAWPLRKFVSACVRLNIGFYTILLVLLFLNYARYRWIIPVVVLAICAHELTYSLGSRILSLLVLLQVGFLYHLLVRKISLARWMAAGVLMGIAFSALEFLREAEFDFSAAQSSVSDRGIRTASEFGAVFLTGFHLYAERATGSLPQADWPMFFSDFISLITFNDFTLWNPMEWYARNYHPDALVAPMTLSPIADSAIWGGELDLLLRGFVNGAFFAFIVRWFLRRYTKWWGLVLYTFCHATAIITLKYSVFYQLTPLLKTMLPAILVFFFVRFLSTRSAHNHSFDLKN